MSTSKQIRRLIEELKEHENVDAATTMRDGRYGVAFFRRWPDCIVTLVEFDLLKLAEELEGEG